MLRSLAPSIMPAVLLLYGVAISAQTAPRPKPSVLGGAGVTVADEFTHVGGVVELDNGMAVIADDEEYRLVLVDVVRGTTRNLGRTGSGPGEFRWIDGLMPAPGNGAFMLDPALHRLLPISAAGSFGTPLTIPAGLMVREVDATGALVGEMFHKRNAQGMADSMYIVRWKPGATRIDTVLSYDAGVSKSVGRGVTEAFPAIDTWTLSVDGEVIVIGARPYETTLFRGSNVARSTRIPFAPIKLTSRDREIYTAARAAEPVRTLGQPGASGRAAAPPPPTFPDVLPAFGGDGLGGKYTVRSRDGNIWVRRLIAPSDSLPRYDVLDGRTGQLLADLQLPPHSRVVGIGAARVYVAVADSDGIERVTPYRYPSILPAK